VLRDITWQVRAQEATLIIGASGSGKSTLAMLIAGLIPHSVEATIEGRINRAAALDRPGAIGFVFQDPEAQFCQLNVGQELAFGLENMAVAPSDMEAHMTRALQQAGLNVPFTTSNHALSGGMQQKLALAAGLVQDPELLIFDEPTANLDPHSTSHVFSQIAQLVADERTVLVVEHKFEHLLEVMPRVLLISRQGRIHAEGETAKVLADEWSWLIAEGLIPKRLQLGWKSPPITPGSGALAPSAGAVMLTAEHVRFSYASPRQQRQLKRQKRPIPLAIDDLSLTIRSHELVAIVGPNGSGKSTLLGLLAGLRKPLTGHITSLPATKDMARPIAFGFQNPEHQFIFERVVDELANRYVDGQPPEAVQALLEKFSLQGHEDQSPFGLSQGQKRRLAVAVMLRDCHDLYLLDEPTFGQDQSTQAHIMEELRALQAQGKSVVITTHDMDLVQEYATRVVVLVRGQVTYDGPVAPLFADPDRMVEANLLVHRQRLVEDTTVAHGAPSRFIVVQAAQAHSPIGRLNPAWKLVTTMVAMIIAMTAHDVWQGVLLASLPTLLLLIGARLTPWQDVKRMGPFIGFFAAYTWTLTAYSRVAPGTPTFHLLWFVLSWTGFHNGLVLAFRMLASVTFGVLYVSTTDVTQLVVSLTRNFHVPPRFSYGSLAGIRVFPLFEEEWKKIRQARMLRGKDVHRSRLTRVVTYALPLLTQAIRIGERVAVAMESRGFRGLTSERADQRTYYLDTPVRPADFLYLALIITVSLVIVVPR
jgi:energy-coupling factor transporter ATP-binding protein EcfA2/energy-coupling factor transporter transmembrane protein EcfT